MHHCFTIGTEKPTVNKLSVFISENNHRNVCVICSFTDGTNSACVVVHFETDSSNPHGLINLNVTKINRIKQEASAYGCIELHYSKSASHHIAVFPFSRSKKMIDGPPLIIMKTSRTTDKTGISAVLPID